MGGWISGLIDGVLNALTSATQAALAWVLGLLSASVFASPDVTALPQVSYVSGRAQLAANASMTLIVMVVGILAMTHGEVQDRYALKELLPRMLLGFVAANMATPIVRAAITGANALTGALTGDMVASQDSFTQIRRVILDASREPAMALAALVLRELALALLVMLVITWLGRIAVLLVVAGTAPLALMCHALPHTDAVARIWWRALLGVLAVQVLQAVGLHLAVATLLSGDANLPALGLPHDPTGLFNILITCFVLWLVIRIPTWVARTAGGTAGRAGSMLGSVLRVVVVQQLLRGIGLRGRRSPGRGNPSGPGLPATHLHSHQHATSHQHDHQHIHLHPPRPPREPGGARRDPPPGPGSGGRPGTGDPPPVRVASWVGRASTAPSSPGRPPRELEGRSALPPAMRPAIGPGPGSGPAGGGPRPRPSPPGGRPGRPARPYTPHELGDGVDLYTQALKRRRRNQPPGSL